jgi:hypothetical protein
MSYRNVVSCQPNGKTKKSSECPGLWLREKMCEIIQQISSPIFSEALTDALSLLTKLTQLHIFLRSFIIHDSALGNPFNKIRCINGSHLEIISTSKENHISINFCFWSQIDSPTATVLHTRYKNISSTQWPNWASWPLADAWSCWFCYRCM